MNEINQFNYSKKESIELINYNSNKFQNTNNNEKGTFSSFTNYNKNNNSNPNNIINKNNNIKNELPKKNNKIHYTCKKTKCIKNIVNAFQVKFFSLIAKVKIVKIRSFSQIILIEKIVII